MKSNVTKADMALKRLLPRYISPQDLPISFQYGGRPVRGVPAEFQPKAETSMPDSNYVVFCQVINLLGRYFAVPALRGSS